MTFGEKVDILSMKFSNMWYRLWICDPEKNYDIHNMYEAKKKSDGEMENLKCYFRKKAKFESIFLRDGGKRLKRLINNSSNSVTPWEIPKGGINDGETELECARREFCEEVNMDSNKYTLLWDVKPVIITHKDDNIIYRSIYYIAFFHNNTKWIPKVNFETSSQLSEVEQVQWVSLDEIKFLNLNESSKKKLINTYTKVFKKKIKSYYYDS
jgi:8-oxo-dGTP pyrophosphatase MutT (NUDIX family)